MLFVAASLLCKHKLIFSLVVKTKINRPDKKNKNKPPKPNKTIQKSKQTNRKPKQKPNPNKIIISDKSQFKLKIRLRSTLTSQLQARKGILGKYIRAKIFACGLCMKVFFSTMPN